jgi:hypothetical protein
MGEKALLFKPDAEDTFLYCKNIVLSDHVQPANVVWRSEISSSGFCSKRRISHFSDHKAYRSVTPNSRKTSHIPDDSSARKFWLNLCYEIVFDKRFLFS